MSNNIPNKTLLKIFDLIQSNGVDDDDIFEVSRLFDPEAVEKFIQAYIQRGVVGDLDLSGDLDIQKLPKGLKFKRLDLDGNKTLKHLPRIEADSIRAKNTTIQTIEDGLKCKWLDLEGNKALKHLPKMEVYNIWATDTNIQTIEDGFKCEYLNLSENQTLKKFPQNFEVERLDLVNTYFSETRTKEEVRKLIKDGGGEVGQILI